MVKKGLLSGIILGTLLFYFCLINLSAQDDRPGSWNSLIVNYDINNRFRIFSEGQIRSYQFYRDFYYYDLKASLNYSPLKWFTCAAGVGSYNTYPKDGDFVTPATLRELRIFEEIVLRSAYKRLHFENRFRVEERFTTDGYKTRFRPRLGLLIPVTHTKIEPKTLYLSLGDEMFISDMLEKNRYYISGGYKFGITSISLGLQHDYDVISKVAKKYLRITLSFDLHNNHISSLYL